MKIAVIPARGGSKRIPRKNIKAFAGKPMICWAIKAAVDSNMFDHIIVSTEDTEIASIAKEHGASVPFLRPPSLSDDFTPTVPVISHAVEECLKLNWEIDSVCCIYPGVPFLEAQDLVNAYDIMKRSDSEFVYPVTHYVHPVQRAMRQLESGQMEFIDTASEMTRTQDLEETFHDAGQFYWGKATAWLAQKKMHSDGLGMIIPNWRVVDIDNLDDWKRAEILFQVIKNF